jgi:hypothetical protein
MWKARDQIGSAEGGNTSGLQKGFQGLDLLIHQGNFLRDSQLEQGLAES